MSTHYMIIGEWDKLLTAEDLKSQAPDAGFVVELVPDPPPSWVAVTTTLDHVHLEFETRADERLVGFERFGANDPSAFIAFIESLGLRVLDEHDDEYEDLYYTINR